MRNPYNYHDVTHYDLDPKVVDLLFFCTKNPQPMLSDISLIDSFDQYWYVTITGYDKDIEPFVPPFESVLHSFYQLSHTLGSHRVGWRYDPIIITDKYDMPYHLAQFERIARSLVTYTEVCVISFVDLYNKTVKNMPGIREVTPEQQLECAAAMVEIAAQYGMTIKTCAEPLASLDSLALNRDGCFIQKDWEAMTGKKYKIPKKPSKREHCQCLLENEIGVYNSCPHGCLYCYANYSRGLVLNSYKKHDPFSPLLIGHREPGDRIRKSKQMSYIDEQLGLF